MSLELPFGVKVVNPKPLEHYYSNDGTPYTSVANANSAVDSAIRYLGLTVNINNVEYWYKDGLTDPDLIIKPIDLHYEHDQQTSSATWNVTHSLGKQPSVMVVDSLNNEVIGDIEYTSINTLTITFTSTFSGKAYMN